MKRRMLAVILGLAIASGGPLRAEESAVDRILRDLKRLGYVNLSVESTLLRRTRILATSEDAQREIIVNPNTGEILRDLWTPIGKVSSKSRSGGLLGSGGDGVGDDDGGDDGGGGGDDDGGGDDGDNSGGGDNSGHGNGEDDGGDND